MKHNDIETMLRAHQQWLRAPRTGKRANFSFQNLSGIDLKGVSLCGAIFHGTNLRGADLSRGHFSGCDFRHACLDEALLVETDMNATDCEGASFRYTNCSHGNFRFAQMKGVHFHRVGVTKTVFDDHN